MDDDSKHDRRLEKLEQQRMRMHEQIDHRRLLIDKRFERARERLTRARHVPNDSQQKIIDAALELLDEEGLNNLSLRKVANRLDMQAPALYWHFKNKESLIDYMAEAILRAEFKELIPRRDDEPWQDWLAGICNRLRHAMQAHRDGARVVAGAHLYPAVTLMKLFEVSMQSLLSAGIELKEANLLVSTVVHFVFGNVIEEQAAPSLDEVKDFIWSKALREEYPLMSRSIQETLADAVAGYDEFEDSLRLIIGYSEKSNKK